MNISREAKVKRITNIKCWPSVVSAIVMFFLFNIVIAVLLFAYISSIASMKFTEMGDSIQSALIYLDTEDGTTQEQQYETVTRLLPDISAVAYLDEDLTETKAFGDQTIDLSQYTKLEGAIRNLVDADIYVPENMAELISVDSTGKQFKFNNEELVELPMQGNMEFKMPKFSGENWIQDEVFGFDLVFVYPSDQRTGYVAVLYRFSLCTEDYIFALVISVTICILFLLLMIYHIVSTIRLLVNRRCAYDALYMDMVTGGDNDMAFYRKAEKLIRKNKKQKLNYAVIHLRLEKYKGLVTCYGVDWGESLVEALYNEIKTLVGKTEVLGHMENGDFGLLLQYDKENELNARMKGLTLMLVGDHPDQKLYFSVGICPVEGTEASPKTLYNNASVARSLIRDENAGEIKWFTESLAEAQKWERKVEGEMENAMREGQFEMYLQPKYTTGSETVGGAEALVRWNHPTEGLISPGRFIPIFEKDGFILTLDDFMIGELAKYQAKWIAEGKEVFPISVNVSRAHFMMPDLAEHIRDIVDRYQVPHNVIELELTESAFFDDKKTLIGIVRKMREYGFPISMDDFGSGYSSLNSLKEIPLDVVKLDAEFFRGEGNDDKGRIIVSETIDLAKSLGMHIVAEGIETREQVDFLKEKDCDLIQGFYFAKPMPVGAFEERAFGGQQ